MSEPVAPSGNCPFCEYPLHDYASATCPTCGYPVFGSETQQQHFRETHEPLRSVLDEGEWGLSWARFFQLWPGVGLLGISGWLFYSGIEPIAQIINVIGGALLIGLFFLTELRPMLAMTISSLLLTGLGVTYLLLHYRWLVIWTPFSLVYLSQLNGLYGIWKIERALKQQQDKMRTSSFPS